MHITPNVGDVIPLQTGDAIILEVRDYNGHVNVLAHRQHPIHPFAIWHWDDGALFSGKYFRQLSEATLEWESS
jgi:hypothetical protein